MTTSIAKFMRDLEQAWDTHQQALLQRRDLAAALASLAAEPAAGRVLRAGFLGADRGTQAHRARPVAAGAVMLSCTARVA